MENTTRLVVGGCIVCMVVWVIISRDFRFALLVLYPTVLSLVIAEGLSKPQAKFKKLSIIRKRIVKNIRAAGKALIGRGAK